MIFVYAEIHWQNQIQTHLQYAHMAAVVIKQRNAAVMEMEMIITQFIRPFLVSDIFHFASRYFVFEHKVRINCVFFKEIFQEL